MTDQQIAREAIMEILDAVRQYLPPDGISAQDCLNRVIGAVDNQRINPLIRKYETPTASAIEARSGKTGTGLTEGESAVP